jgi:hypothetical protein
VTKRNLFEAISCEPIFGNIKNSLLPQVAQRVDPNRRSRKLFTRKKAIIIGRGLVWLQGDQVSFVGKKTHPKPFFSKFTHNFYCENGSPKI